MRESIPNRRQGPFIRRCSGAATPYLLSFLLLSLISCGGSLLLDQSHVDEVRGLINDGYWVEAEAKAAELLRQSKAGEGSSALARAEVMTLHASILRRTNQEKRSEAKALAEQALKLKIGLVGEMHPSVADSLMDLGNYFESINEPDESRRAWERSLEIRRTVLGKEHPSVARLLIKLGSHHYHTTQDVEGAMARFDEARRIQEMELPADHPDVAERIMAIGVVHHWAGDYHAARRCYEQGLDIRIRCLRPVHPHLVTCHSNLGLVLEALGEFPAARRHKEAAIEMDVALLGPEHPFVAHDLMSMASLLHRMGDLEEAERLYRRALEIRVKNVGEDDPESLEAARLLAILLGERRNFGEARELYERVLKHAGEEDIFATRNKVELLNRYGSLLCSQGEEEEAADSIERSLSLARDKLGVDDLDTRMVMLNRASLHFSRSELEQADRLFRQGLENYEVMPGRSLLVLVYGLVHHAQVLDCIDRADTALASALRAETLAREHLRSTARSLEAGLALKYAASGVDGLHAAVSIAAGFTGSDPAAAQEAAADAMVRCRALVFDELAARVRAVRDSADPHIVALQDELSSARESLARLVVRSDGNEAADLREKIDQAAQRKQRAERELAESSTSFRQEQEEQQIGIAMVRAALPGDAALVAYLRYQDHLPKDPGHGTDVSFSYLALIIAGHDTPARLVRLGEAREIDRLVLAWRDELLKGSAADIPGLDVDLSYRVAGANLREQIWDPLLPHLGTPSRVFVVPDSALHLVSFASLPVGDSDFLIEEGPAIHYLSAEREIDQWGDGSASDESAGTGLLLIGNPAFGSAAPTQSFDTFDDQKQNVNLSLRYAHLDFSALPATTEEIRQVGSLWHGLESGRGRPREPLITLSGDGATELAFKQGAPGCRILHLATHAYFLQPESSQRESDRGLQRIQTGRRAFQVARPDDNPLLRAGLALAGANNRSGDDEDGVLTAEEIVSMDLSAVQLAVLSACDTGLGTVQSGEGVFGLRRAFRLAGVNTVINSLWPVEDESARQWMEIFYMTRLLDGASVTDCARQASLGVLNTRRENGFSDHPFFWAAFVAAGDWR